MLELAEVTKHLGGQRVIDAVSLSVPAGRTTVLIGPSGCGKSTLLRLMLGLLKPDAGAVRLDGRPVSDAGGLRRLRHRVGYVIQDGGLFPHLTARGNAELLVRDLGWPADRIAARLDELVALTSFPRDGLGRYPVELSGGQRQRVALMRALMHEPDLLLMDEPLGALDPMIRAELQADLRAIFGRLGKTVVMVTHDLAEAAYFGHQIVLLRGGAVVQRGTLAEMTDDPADAFVTRFVRAQRSVHLEAAGPGADVARWRDGARGAAESGRDPGGGA